MILWNIIPTRFSRCIAFAATSIWGDRHPPCVHPLFALILTMSALISLWRTEFAIHVVRKLSTPFFRRNAFISPRVSFKGNKAVYGKVAEKKNPGTYIYAVNSQLTSEIDAVQQVSGDRWLWTMRHCKSSQENAWLFIATWILSLNLQLFIKMAPKTVDNFLSLCTGEKGNSRLYNVPLHYKVLAFEYIKTGKCCQVNLGVFLL